MLTKRNIDSVSLEVFEIGNKSFPTILFLPGSNASYRFYEHLLNNLALRYHVICPSLPGHGKSASLRENTSAESYARIIHSLIEDTELRIISGHSMGAAIGILVAKKLKYLPELVLFDMYYKRPEKNFYLTLFKGWVGGYLEFWENTDFKEKIQMKFLPWDMRNMFLRRPRESYKIKKVLQEVDITEQMTQLENRTRLVYGKEDSFFDEKYMKKARDLIPNSELDIVDKKNHNWIGYRKNIDFVSKRYFE